MSRHACSSTPRRSTPSCWRGVRGLLRRPRPCWSASGRAAPGWPSGCSATWACAGEPGVISSALHRDDFGSRGMAAGADATKLPFAIDGRHILLIDDVLYTGRTIRAVINELYDFGRPASVHAGGAGRPRRARAADRSRPSPPRASRCRRRRRLSLARDDDGRFSLRPSTEAGLMLSRRNPQLNRHGELIHLLSIEGLPQGGADADPRHRGHLPVGQRPRRQEGAAAARQERLQPVLREQHAHAHHLRDRGQAAVGRRHQPRHRALAARPRARACSTPSPTCRRCTPTCSSCATARAARPT